MTDVVLTEEELARVSKATRVLLAFNKEAFGALACYVWFADTGWDNKLVARAHDWPAWELIQPYES